jgi:hypothetical protein
VSILKVATLDIDISIPASVKDEATGEGSITFAHTTFAQRHLPMQHLPMVTFTQKNICPEKHLPRRKFAQMDVCPERHLPTRTFYKENKVCLNHKFVCCVV